MDAPVWLALSETGQIVSANAAAGNLWVRNPAELIGRPFVSLFAFEIVSDDPDFLEAQWEIVQSTAVAQQLALSIKLHENATPIDVRVELEAAAGNGFGWIAHIKRGSQSGQTNSPLAPIIKDGSAFSLLTQSDAAGFFDLDFAHGETVYSAAWKRILGYPDADLANSYDTWLELIHPDDSAAAPDQVGRQVKVARRSFSVDFRMKHRRGHWAWVQCIGVQQFSAEGELERVVGFHFDISERKELEELGIVAEDRLNSLAESGELAIFDLDFEEGRTWTSMAWQALVGNNSDSPDLGSFALHFPESESDLAKFLTSFGDAGPWSTGPCQIRTTDQQDIPVLLGLNRQISRRGELHRIVGFAIKSAPPTSAADVPVKKSDGSIDLGTLNSLNEAVIITDRRGKIVAINTKCERLTGIPFASALGQPTESVFKLIAIETGRSAADALDQALLAGDNHRLYVDYALVAEGVEPRPIVWGARVLENEQGKSTGIVIVFRDPNEMSLSPEELIRANRFDSVGQLAGGIAHDFNNLLTTILGAVSIAKENRDYDKLDDAETACMAAKTLTRQLLQFSKGSAAGNFSIMRPSDVIRDAIRVAASGSPVVIKRELDDHAGPIEADRGQIIQVFQNLIINARQAMEDQSRGIITIRNRIITLTEGQLAGLEGGDYVQIEVEDNGAGIPEDKVGRIFEPFFTTKKTGTGLGLATVLSIVRKHGGQLGVKSVVGTGTTFTVFLPVTEKSLEVTVRRPPSLRFGTGRILVLDDDKQLCHITKAMLESLDYKVDVAHKGEDAIVFYRRYHAVDRPYDAVLLDLTIVGGMGGEETFRNLQEMDTDVRAIVCSGYDDEEMARHFLEAGFCGYLTKPYRIADLSKMLKTVVGR